MKANPPSSQSFLTCLCVALAFAAYSSPALATTTTWTASTGNWFTAGNWSNGVPTSSTDAIINNGGTATIASSGAAAHAVTLGANPGDSGSLVVDGGSLSVPLDCGTYADEADIRRGIYVGYGGTGHLSIINGGMVASGYGYIALLASDGTHRASNGAVTIDGTGSAWTLTGNGSCLARFFVGGDNTSENSGGTALLTVTGGGALTVYDPHAIVSMPVGPSGTVTGDGTITVSGLNNSSISRMVQIKGTLTPTGILPIVGDLSFAPSGSSEHNVTPTSSDYVAVKTLSFIGGVLTLNGHLSVTMTGTFSPSVTRYTLLEAQGGVSGTFASGVSIKYPVDQGFTPAISYDASHVYLDLVFGP